MVYIFIRQDANNYACFFLQAERGYGTVCYKQLVASFKELRGIHVHFLMRSQGVT